MLNDYIHLEHLSIATGLGITVLDTSGQTLFESSAYIATNNFIQTLYATLDCEESCRIAILYGCYQARRFGGRYVFYAPSGLVYCAAPLLDGKGRMQSGVLAGPFLMTSHEEYMDFDILEHFSLSQEDVQMLSEGLQSIPTIAPKQAHSISELLYYVASAYSSRVEFLETAPVQTDGFAASYPIEKEEELLSAIRKGDSYTANAVMGDIIRQIMLQNDGNVEVLRSRVVELTVLLSRASLKGGADTNAILGLNYDYLREIDSFSTVEDIVLWLRTVTQRFIQHVLDFSDAKHADTIYKAVIYIKRNYATKITLQELANHLSISQSYFCRIFREETGQTPGGYLNFVRIEEAKKHLRNSDVDIIDIPALVGFEGQSYFTKVFKKETGFTPGQYRRENIERR